MYHYRITNADQPADSRIFNAYATMDAVWSAIADRIDNRGGYYQLHRRLVDSPAAFAEWQIPHHVIGKSAATDWELFAELHA